ncbi:hypothetical protein P7K49_036892, partial [Saguinus oedipus]
MVESEASLTGASSTKMPIFVAPVILHVGSALGDPATVQMSASASEQNLERQVLQTQCRRLEARHYSLSLTAEQLSHSVA